MEELKDTYVYLIIDTDNINKGNINDYVEFSDNRCDTPSYFGNNHDEFVSMVDKGKKIIWIGIVKDPEENRYHSVAITQISIKKESEHQILVAATYEDKIKKGIVVGEVKETGVYKGNTEDYNITFLVNGKDSYTIDPKMQMS